MDNSSQTLNSFLESIVIPEVLVSVISTHPYLIVFVGLLLGGETVLLPAIYFSITGVLNVWYVMSIMFLATIISDGFWYSIGRGFGPKCIQTIVRNKRKAQLAKLSQVISGKELGILFYSKFIYGTRIAAQIFCGARKVNFFSYSIVNALAISSLGFAYYVLVRSSVAIVTSQSETQYLLLALWALIIVVAALIHFLVYSVIKRKWYQ